MLVVGTGDSSFHRRGVKAIEDHESPDEFVDRLLKLIQKHTSLERDTALHFIEHVIVGRSLAEIAENSDPTLKTDTVYRHFARTAEALRKKFGEMSPGELLGILSDQRDD